MEEGSPAESSTVDGLDIGEDAWVSMVVREARIVTRVGGSLPSVSVGDGALEGTTWFWPGERHVAALADCTGVEVFDRHTDDDAVLQKGRTPAGIRAP